MNCISFLEYSGQSDRYATKSNCLLHSVITTRKKEDSQIPAASTLVFYTWKDLCASIFTYSICYWSSKSRCVKHRLWKSKAKRLSIWGLEIRIWIKSPNDPELTSLASEDWNCADTGRYKRQKNGIKPYLLLPYRGFPTPTSMISQRRWSPSRKQKQEPHTLCL